MLENLRRQVVILNTLGILQKNLIIGMPWFYGLATSAILSSEPKIIPKLIENGALGASVSGNGPSIAAIVRNDSISKIKKIFSSLDGNTTVSEINNKKAEVHEM